MSPATLSRRQVLRTCTAVLALPLLAACGGTAAGTASTAATTSASASSSAASASSVASPASSASATTATSPTASAAQPGAAKVALTFWANGGKGDPSYAAWTQRLDDFNKAHPDSPATMDAPADLDNKLAAAVAGGTPPSTAVQDRYTIAGKAAKSLMQDISALASQAGIKAEDQQPWCWQEVAIKGKLYGLPYSTDTRMFYVNVGHLQSAGVPTTAPKTLQDFTQIGQQLTVKQGDSYQRIGFFPWNDNWSPYGFGWLFGGGFYDAENNVATLEDPKVIASFDWAGGVARQLGYQAVQDFIKAHSGNLFIAQVLSSYINSTSFLITVNGAGPSLNWTPWAPPPPQGIDKTSTWSGGFADVLPSGAKNADLAFELMRYLTDATFQQIQNKSGRLPTIKAVAADPYWDTVDPRVKQFVQLLPYSHSRPVTPQVNIMTTELNNAYTAVLSGQKSAAEALKQANQLVNDAIKENRV